MMTLKTVICKLLAIPKTLKGEYTEYRGTCYERTNTAMKHKIKVQ